MVQRVNVSMDTDVADVSNVEPEVPSASIKNLEVAVVTVEMEVNYVAIHDVVSIVLIVTALRHVSMAYVVDVAMTVMAQTDVSINGIRTGVSSVPLVGYVNMVVSKYNVFLVGES